jgi:hypothetical protein
MRFRRGDSLQAKALARGIVAQIEPAHNREVAEGPERNAKTSEEQKDKRIRLVTGCGVMVFLTPKGWQLIAQGVSPGCKRLSGKAGPSPGGA